MARTARFLCLVLYTTALAAAGAAAPTSAAPESAERPVPADAAETRARMQELVGALQLLLPLALADGEFSDPARRDEVLAAMAGLVSAGEALERHGADREIAFTHLSRSLAADAREIRRRMEQGRTEEARFLLSELSERCIACHTRLPSHGDSPLGARLYGELPEDLDLDQRLRLLTATRQFDQVLGFSEQRMADPALPRIDLELLLQDYLVIAVRVEGDLARARATLERLQKGRTMPLYLQRRLRVWTDALTELRLEAPAGEALARARAVQQAAATLRRFPADPDALVHDLVASSLIHRALEAQDLSGTGRAEAYYALGLAEIHSEAGTWLAEPETYLEAAVRAAPGSELAGRAYALLEEFTLAGFTGSDGTSLPPDVRSWLEDLRKLAHRSMPAGSP